MTLMVVRGVWYKLVALICAAVLVIVGVAFVLENLAHESQESAEQKRYPDQRLPIGSAPHHDNQNSTNILISFNADEIVNDVPNSLKEGTLNDSGLEGMLPQIAEDCESRVQWRFDTYAPGSDPDRANRTIPKGFQVRKSGVSGAGLGVWTLEEIPACTMIGPYGGVKKYDKNIWEKTWIYGWIIVDGDGTAKYVVDAENPAQSNWMRYINCAKSEESQNFHPFQYLGEMFYFTRHKIRAGRELFVWYGDGYGEALGLLSTV